MPNIERALISVTDKRGVKELAKGLAELDVQMHATKGTYNYLVEADIPNLTIRALQTPEYLNGKIKTLNLRIWMAILADRGNKKEMKELKKERIDPIDLVVVNLYIDKIDVGGYVLLRAAAKNYRYVVPLCDPEAYTAVLKEMRENGRTVSESTSYNLAVRTLHYLEESDRQSIRLLGPK